MTCRRCRPNTAFDIVCSSTVAVRNAVWLVFTAQCTLVQSAVLRSHVVRPSVCPSVTLVDCDRIGWKSWKLIARTIPSFQLGTVTLAGWLVSVRAINRSTSGFPNALVFCCCCMNESQSAPSSRHVTTFTSVIQRRFAVAIRVDSVTQLKTGSGAYAPTS